MTTDEFDTKYKLLKQITTRTGRSFTAQECASGRAILVHYLPENGSMPGASARRLIELLEPRDRSRILQVLTVEESTVVVTQFLEGFEGFEAWLRDRLASSLPRPAEPSPATTPGEFTQLFDAGALPSAREPVDQAPPAPEPSERTREGSFTEQFRAPPESTTAPFPAPAPSAPPPSDPAGRGAFTELFRPPPQSNTDPFPSPAGANAPVELRSIRIPSSPPAPPRVINQPPPPPIAPPKVGSPLSPPVPKPVLPMPRLAPSSGEPIVKPPARDAAPPPASGWSGESDYTRLLRPTPTPTEAAPPAGAPPRSAGSPAAPVAPAPPSAPPEPARSIVPLLLVLNILVVIATGLVLFFALKRR